MREIVEIGCLMGFHKSLNVFPAATSPSCKEQHFKMSSFQVGKKHCSVIHTSRKIKKIKIKKSNV